MRDPVAAEGAARRLLRGHQLREKHLAQDQGSTAICPLLALFHSFIGIHCFSRAETINDLPVTAGGRSVAKRKGKEALRMDKVSG